MTIIAGWKPSGSAWAMLRPPVAPIHAGTKAMTKTRRHGKPGITTHLAAVVR